MKRFFALAFPMALTGIASAQAIPPNLRALTTAPENDNAPTVSADGRHVVYVSQRSGNDDLYAIDRQSGGGGLPTALAPSPARDVEPALSPDGKWLAWISTREDAFGDVWVLHFPDGRPIQVGKRGERENAPHWIDEGGKLRLRFRVETAEKTIEWREVSAGSWTAAPRVLENGRDYAPSRTLAAVALDDTNGDGLVDATRGDDPSLCRVDAQGRALRQLSPPLPGLNGATESKSGIVFSARFRRGLDVFATAEPFPVARVQSETAALEAARAAWRDRPSRPFDAVAFARQGVWIASENGESRAAEEAALLGLTILRESDRPEQALVFLQDAQARRAKATAAFAIECALWKSVLRLDAAQRTGAAADVLAARREEAVKQLAEAFGNRELSLATRAWAGLERARQLDKLDHHEDAILAAQEAEQLEGLTPDDRLAATRVRATLTGALLPEEGQRLLVEALRKGDATTDAAEKAAVTLSDIAVASVAELDGKVIALRKLTSSLADLDVVQAAGHLREGRLFLDAAQRDEAEEAFTAARPFSEKAPRLSAEAAFDIARMAAEEGRYLDAIQTYESVSQEVRDRIFPEAPRFYEDAREGYIRQTLEKGQSELRLGDPWLALTTFTDLIAREPRLVEAWRGRMDAESRTQTLFPARFAEYERQASANPKDDLAQYLYGLALTYDPDFPRRSLTVLRRATALDNSVPYYHQTLGFACEHFARVTNDRSFAAEAAEEYQKALGLLDPSRRPGDYARLLPNAGNAALALGQYGRAAEYYGQRFDQGVPFDDPRTEYQIRRNQGIALFRSSRSAEAATAFVEAQKMLDILAAKQFLPPAAVREQQTELMDREALALMDAGRHAEAATGFLAVAERNGASSLNRARAWRNAAFAMLRQSAQAEGLERARERNEAKDLLLKSLELLESPKLTMPATAGKKGLFDFEVSMSAGGPAGARQELTKQDEIYLVRAALARLSAETQDAPQAAKALADQLASQQKLEGADLPYYRAARLVTLDQYAEVLADEGKLAEAANALAEAVELARFAEKKKEFINAGGLSQALAHLTEIALQPGGEKSLPVKRLRASWLGEGVADGEPLVVLEDLTRAALARRDEKDVHVLLMPAHRARVLLAAALVAESRSQSTAEPVAGGLHLARAASLAEQAIGQTGDPLADGEARRTAVLAQGLLVRAAWRGGDAETWSRARRRALSFAEITGFPDLEWWIEAQAALSPDDAFAREAAKAVLERMESVPMGLGESVKQFPSALLDRCERLTMDEAFAREDWKGALALTERWRVARLRLLSEGVWPPARSDRPDDAAWLLRAETLHTGLREAIDLLRATPIDGPIADAQARVDARLQEWTAHLEEGRNANLPSAIFAAPRVTEIEDPVAGLMDALALPEPPVLLLATPSGTLAWTPGGAKRIENEGDVASLGSSPFWFVLGDGALPANLPEKPVHILTFETTIQAMAEFRLNLGTAPVVWEPPLEKTPGDATQATNDAMARPVLMLEHAVHALDLHPSRWFIGDTGVPASAFVSASPGANELTATFEGSKPGDAAAKRLLFASMVAQSGSGSANIDGESWLGLLFDPKAAPEMAEQELAAAEGLAAGWIKDGEENLAYDPLRRVALLRGALEKPSADVVEAKTLLAQLDGDLGRPERAAATMRDVVKIAREAGNETDLARALRLQASYSLEAFEFDEAVGAYAEAESLYAKLGQANDAREMKLRGGIALENGGRYDKAIERYESVLADAKAAGDVRLECEQWRRIGRIYLHRLNDYPYAEDAFRQALAAAQRANAEDLVIQLTLDLARVDERLGRYEPAISMARMMEEQAAAANVPLLEVDALNLRAFTEWVRANYFDSYKALREAMTKAEAIGAREQVLIGHNTGGLLAWSLNDTDGALREFGAALDLSRQLRLPTEESSTLNNRALVYRSMRRFDEAMADLNSAKALDERYRSTWGQGYVQKNIGITLQQMGRAQEAIEPLSRAVNLSEGIGDRTNRAKALVALGDAQRDTKQSDAARKSYQEALAEGRALPLPEVTWRALYGLALLSRTAGDATAARKNLADAIDVVEGLRARIRIEEFQDGFLADKQSLYDEMVSELLREGETRMALDYSERSRARNFIDLLGNQKVSVAAPQDQAMLDREKRLRADVEVLEKRVGSAKDADKAELQKQLDEARRQYSDLLIELRAQNPQLSNFVEVKTMTSEELQQLIEPDTALLVYHVLPDGLAIWVVRRTSVDVVQVPLTRNELATRILAYRRDMQNFDSVEDEGRILSTYLWQPVAGLVTGAKRIGVVPHRELHLFPFASLRANGGYVIDTQAIFYTPSASVLAYTLARRGAHEANNRVLAIGNPNLGDARLDLPFAEKEAERIPWTFPNADVMTGDKATESWLADHIADYGIVHIATHGEYNPSVPLLSAIELTPDAQNDGKLTAGEVFSLSMKADLVALSACQTGLGRLSTGDDVVGLNRSFVYAGTRQILSSLWRVDDVSTAILIKHFYRNMTTMDRAEALREAQIEVRRRYPHPAHWSGLFLSGDWE